MKIIQPGYIPPNQNQVKKSEDISSKKSDAFQKILKQTSDTTTNGSTQSLSRLNEPTALSPIIFETKNDSLPDYLETALGHLQDYASKLADPQKSLKDIEPSLLQLMDDTKVLDQQYMQDPNTEPELQDVMQRFIVRANTEYYKFYRGDYAD